MVALWRVRYESRSRLAIGDSKYPTHVLAGPGTLTRLLSGTVPFRSMVDLQAESIASPIHILSPIDDWMEVWAAGVTFETSRYNRELESTQPDLYRDIYLAERPELFLKATPGTVVGPDEAIGIRANSRWNVPEPELTLVINALGEVVAYTVGNDVSSRSIEGENALYLPQAKTYDASCAIGPCLIPVEEAPPLQDMTIELTIFRSGDSVFHGLVQLADLRRPPSDLASWLFRARTFPRGVAMLTGTGIVPPAEFSLAAGDIVRIFISGVGTLSNVVKVVGREDLNAAGKPTG